MKSNEIAMLPTIVKPEWMNKLKFKNQKDFATSLRNLTERFNQTAGSTLHQAAQHFVLLGVLAKLFGKNSIEVEKS